MAISTNGGSNPTTVLYNWQNCTEVWYKRNQSDTGIKVWPDGGSSTQTEVITTVDSYSLTGEDWFNVRLTYAQDGYGTETQHLWHVYPGVQSINNSDRLLSWNPRIGPINYLVISFESSKEPSTVININKWITASFYNKGQLLKSGSIPPLEDWWDDLNRRKRFVIGYWLDDHNISPYWDIGSMGYTPILTKETVYTPAFVSRIVITITELEDQPLVFNMHVDVHFDK